MVVVLGTSVGGEGGNIDKVCDGLREAAGEGCADDDDGGRCGLFVCCCLC